jgi:hypothetical protein
MSRKLTLYAIKPIEEQDFPESVFSVPAEWHCDQAGDKVDLTDYSLEDMV